VTAPQGQYPPANPWFSQEELHRFAECLTGDSDRDQACFRSLLATVSELLGETDLQRLLEKLVEHTISTTGTERGILFLGDLNNLEIRVARDRKGQDLGKEPAFGCSRSVPNTVLRDNKPIIARVSDEGDVLDLTHSVASLRLRQVMCAPVRARGRTLGALYVDSTLRGPPFSPADLMLFHAQAGLMGMAIENNRLFHETIEARAMHQQLSVAREIQQRLLPESPVEYGPVMLAGISHASDRVGGDYFDYFPVDMDHIGLSVGDVSGHGIGPALIMSNVRAHLRGLLQTRRSLGGLYGLMNRALCADLNGGMFVSLFVAVYDRKQQLLEFQNAGHVAPLLYHPERDRFREIGANAPALGIIDDISAGPCPSVTVEPGEFFCCYTDGVTERQNRAHELYGDERVKTKLREAIRGGADPSGVVEAIVADCEQHAEGLPPRDDVTIVVARF
jgi:sigma-B regulation protein RsbU (phosphoserine phosphatase)